MKKRLFIAINLPEDVKDKIEKAVEEIRYKFINDVRFLSRDNWHITITFLGDQDDKSLPAIIQSMKGATSGFQQPIIRFADIDYGPKGKPPRMIWLNGAAESAKDLDVLKRNLDDGLVENGVIFKKERRHFNIHITLARFSFSEDLPVIKSDFKTSFQAKSLDMMESRFLRSGAEYNLLQTMAFKL
ncbi:MAG: RNA 2',3'-cyclic phosphodiesterase [Candidatus Harrisonbacteria bacterium]|nr:RNA 2',3'-cyclic phosphodiesterase [Candidatus Harrisonbacteria bacterium]